MRRTPTPPWEPHAAQLQTPSGALFLFGFVPLLLLLPLLGRFGAAGFAVQMEADEAQQSRQQRQAQQWEQPVQRPPPTAGTGQSHQLHLEAQHRIACRAEVEMGNKGGWGGGEASSLLGCPPPKHTTPALLYLLGQGEVVELHHSVHVLCGERGCLGGLGCCPPPPRCSVHGGRGGVYWGQPPLTSSPCKGFWVSECPPRSPSCPQDMSTFSRPQWGWYIPHSVLWGRIGGRGGGGPELHPSYPPPFQVPHLQRGRTHL